MNDVLYVWSTPERCSDRYDLHVYERTERLVLSTRASLKPMQPMQLHWAPRLCGPRAMVFG